MTRPRIELHIEELVLQGFPPGADRYALAQAVERELGRLLTERGVDGWPSGDHHTPHVDAGAFSAMPSDDSAVLGARIAQNLNTRLGR